jgi:hypothetical protein
MRKHQEMHELGVKKHEQQKVTDRLAADPTGAAHQSVIEDSLRPLLENLHRTMSAPVTLERDPVSGRIISARRTPMN